MGEVGTGVGVGSQRRLPSLTVEMDDRCVPNR